MEFLIVGPGATGCLFAAYLKRAGHGATLLDYRTERANLLNRRGIEVEGIGGRFKADVPVITGEPASPPDIVLVCVKAGKTRIALTGLSRHLADETRVLTLQNGLGNMEVLRDLFGTHRVVGGVTAEGATLLGPGQTRHAGKGDTIIGSADGHIGPIQDIVSAFRSAGLQARAAEQIDDVIWGKLIINVGINALTAITRLRNGRLPEIPGTLEVMKNAVGEAKEVATARGIHLPYTDPLGRVIEVCKATAGNVASMLQDILNRRITEVEFINGAIVREGEATGIPTPVNKTITSLVQAIQETYKEQLT